MNQSPRSIYYRKMKGALQNMKIHSGFLSAAVLAAVPLLIQGAVLNMEKGAEVYAEESQEQLTEKTSEQQTDQALEQMVEQTLAGLDPEEKAAQMFVVLPEQLTGVDVVTVAGETTQNAFNRIPVGGLVYMEQNLESEEQIRDMISGVQQFSQERTGLPAFICVDEEGGTVSRISGRGFPNVPYIEDMADIGQSGDPNLARSVGSEIGEYLSRMGFNVDFAPVADVLSNPANSVVKYRSFGSNPQTVSGMVTAELDGLQSKGIYGTLKHFPGHGATEGDTHEGGASTPKTLEELRSCELIPFQEGIEQGAEFVMVGHISLPNVTGDDTPASLSHEITTGILREEMGFEGIIVTDALNMGAISQNYSSAEAAVQAVNAGADLLLMPSDLQTAYNGILEAVENGTLTQERIDESVRRILRVKLEMMETDSPELETPSVQTENYGPNVVIIESVEREPLAPLDPNLSRTADEDTEEDTQNLPDENYAAENVQSTSNAADEKLETVISTVRDMLPGDNGNWSVGIIDLVSGSEETINDGSMQAASLIKLYIMGAVYQNYGDLTAQYGTDTIDSYLYSMITVSDNDAANTLVNYLGGGDSSAGRSVVNSYCQEHGYFSSSMGRMLLQSNAAGDNYTSVSDCAHFLQKVYEGNSEEYPFADQMYSLLKQQTRRNKIPSQLPEGVSVANKTGELSTVENDAGILYNTANDLILVFMSQNLSDTWGAQNRIGAISRTIYDYYS